MARTKWVAVAALLGGICFVGYQAMRSPQNEPVSVVSDAVATARWVVDPKVSGPNLPPVGRSLFDHLFAHHGSSSNGYDLPYPFERLLERVDAQMVPGGLAAVLIPLGRSLQRNAAAPEFFKFPRVVVAALGEPNAPGSLFLKNRLYLGYLEKANVIEVISYNEEAARFEFQIVKNYGEREPQVFYANRSLCLSCHQNAAPIFARPLWDETHANPKVKARLAQVGRSFYNVPWMQGVDIAYQIDAATDRANLFALTQRIWQEGCVPAPHSAFCRADLLKAAIQLRLSAYRGADVLDSAVGKGWADLWQRAWPSGLQVPTADIPNRDPFREVIGAQAVEILDEQTFNAVAMQANIPGLYEPLKTREAAAHWPLADKVESRYQLALGVGEFFSDVDVGAISTHLIAQPVATMDVPLICKRGPVGLEETQSRIHCEGQQGAIKVIMDGYVMLQDNVLNGELSRLQWGPELIEGVVLASQAADGFVSMELHDGKPLFLKSGDQLSALAMPASPQAETATGMLRVARRGLLLDQWFDRLRAGTSAEANDALSAKPLRREAVMRAISHDWGVPWVSSSVASLSPPMLLGEQVVPQPSANHATFSRYCGSCHATTEAFPPNFLYGNSVAVDDKLRHCAERIYYRLALWDVAELERPKAAMPPVYSLGAHHVSAAQWVAHDDLAALRQSAYDLLSESTRRSPAEFLKQDYGRLQPCVVNNVTH